MERESMMIKLNSLLGIFRLQPGIEWKFLPTKENPAPTVISRTVTLLGESGFLSTIEDEDIT